MKNKGLIYSLVWAGTGIYILIGVVIAIAAFIISAYTTDMVVRNLTIAAGVIVWITMLVGLIPAILLNYEGTRKTATIFGIVIAALTAIFFIIPAGLIAGGYITALVSMNESKPTKKTSSKDTSIKADAIEVA